MPLAFLFEQTLVFPDAAPSRFATSLRSSSLGPLERQIEAVSRAEVHGNNQAAALHALSLVAALSRHDRFTRGHTERVRAYADLIAEEMGLPREDRDKLAWGVVLHDIGKLSVPAEILNKRSALTDEEWDILRHHPEAGAEFVEPLRPWLGEWVNAAVDHHERYDGTGYPYGLDNTQISLAGRITAVADAFDVINSARSYKAPMSPEAARQELVRCAGTQFDPAVVRAMVRVSIKSSRRNLGAFAWLAEAPAVIRSILAAASTPAVAATTAAATITAGGAAPLAPIVESMPAEVAFAAEEVVDDQETEVWTRPSTTTTQSADPAIEGEEPVTNSDTPVVDDVMPNEVPVDDEPSPVPTTQAPPGLAPTPPPAAETDGAATVVTVAPPTTAAPVDITVPATTTTLAGSDLESVSFFLENSVASGDTTSSLELPLSLERPQNALSNLDTDRDDMPGLLLKKDSAGLTGDDPEKTQTWVFDVDETLSIDREAEFRLDVAETDFERGVVIGYEVEVLHCAATCIELASGSASTASSRKWSSTTIDLGQITTTLEPGDRLVVRVAVPDSASESDVMFGFGARGTQSFLHFK